MDREKKILWIGSALGTVGLAFVLLPVISVFFASNEVEPVEQTALVAIYPYCLLIGVFLFVTGITAFLSVLFQLDIGGAGTWKFGAYSFPIKVEGAIFVYFILLFATFLATKALGLEKLPEAFLELRKEQDKRIAAQAQVRGLEVVVRNMREIVASQIKNGAGGEIRLRVQCKRRGKSFDMVWEHDESTFSRAVVYFSGRGSSTVARDESAIINPTLTGDYRELEIAGVIDDKTLPILSAAFQWEESVLVGTIWPEDSSLRQLCLESEETRNPRAEHSVAVPYGPSSLNNAAELGAEE